LLITYLYLALQHQVG